MIDLGRQVRTSEKPTDDRNGRQSQLQTSKFEEYSDHKREGANEVNMLIDHTPKKLRASNIDFGLSNEQQFQARNTSTLDTINNLENILMNSTDARSRRSPYKPINRYRDEQPYQDTEEFSLPAPSMGRSEMATRTQEAPRLSQELSSQPKPAPLPMYLNSPQVTNRFAPIQDPYPPISNFNAMPAPKERPLNTAPTASIERNSELQPTRIDTTPKRQDQSPPPYQPLQPVTAFSQPGPQNSFPPSNNQSLVTPVQFSNPPPAQSPPPANFGASMVQSNPPPQTNVVLNGQHTKQYPNGVIYSGNFTQNQKSGSGRQQWPDGTMYEGQWQEGTINGSGRMLFSSGDIYEGEWKRNMANGKGRYVKVEGGEYVGDWVDDRQNGQGVETTTDGDRYEGGFKNGKKEGPGKCTWNNGSIYEGQWMGNKMNGDGTFTWPDGRAYQGQWRNGKMQGQGWFKWPDGSMYKGDYNADKRHGMGEMVYASKKVYRGQWSHGELHGEGAVVGPNGAWRRGVWSHGRRVKWLA